MWEGVSLYPAFVCVHGCFSDCLYGLMRLLVAADSLPYVHEHIREPRGKDYSFPLIHNGSLFSCVCNEHATNRERKRNFPLWWYRLTRWKLGGFIRCWCTLNFTGFLKNLLRQAAPFRFYFIVCPCKMDILTEEGLNEQQESCHVSDRLSLRWSRCVRGQEA